MTFCFVLPLEIPVGSISQKPIDLVMSDFVFVITSFIMMLYLLLNKPIIFTRNIKLVVFIIFVYVFEGMLHALFLLIDSNDIMPLVSSIRFYKPMFFLIIGVFIAHCEKKFIVNFDTNMIFSTLIVSILLIISTFLDSGFPNSMWGKYILFQDIYGFPNASMSFFAFLSLFLLAQYLRTKSILYGAVYVLLALNIVLSLSRSSTIVLIIGTIILGSLFRSAKQVILYVAITFLCVVSVLFILKDLPEFENTFELVNDRIQRTLGNTENDATSGRMQIWKETIRIIMDKPFFGYGFEPFSNFLVDYDTPHQQYLEVLYKTGIIGFLMYSFIVLFMLRYLYIKSKNQHDNDVLFVTVRVMLAGLIALSIGNFTQPNFSYAVLGNLLFFMLGVVLVSEYKLKKVTLE